MIASLEDINWYKLMPKEYKDKFIRLVYTSIPRDLSFSTKEEILDFFLKL